MLSLVMLELLLQDFVYNQGNDVHGNSGEVAVKKWKGNNEISAIGVSNICYQKGNFKIAKQGWKCSYLNSICCRMRPITLSASPIQG